MKNSGVCPKCGCTKIAGPHGTKLINLPRFKTTTLQALVCSECGYTEWYSDIWGLENVRKYGRFLSRPEGETGRVCPFCSTKVRPDSTYCSECGNNI